MNLVAKEFVAARHDERGVLILSCFTGAAHELRDALQINPYDIDQTAEAIPLRSRMQPEEKNCVCSACGRLSGNTTFTAGRKPDHGTL